MVPSSTGSRECQCNKSSIGVHPHGENFRGEPNLNTDHSNLIRQVGSLSPGPRFNWKRLPKGLRVSRPSPSSSYKSTDSFDSDDDWREGDLAFLCLRQPRLDGNSTEIFFLEQKMYIHSDQQVVASQMMAWSKGWWRHLVTVFSACTQWIPSRYHMESQSRIVVRGLIGGSFPTFSPSINSVPTAMQPLWIWLASGVPPYGSISEEWRRRRRQLITGGSKWSMTPCHNNNTIYPRHSWPNPANGSLSKSADGGANSRSISLAV